jgi:hypothetical protein
MSYVKPPYGVIIYTRSNRDGSIEASTDIGDNARSFSMQVENSGAPRCAEAHERVARELLRIMHGGLLISPWKCVAIGDNPSRYTGSCYAFVFARGDSWDEVAA